MKKNAIRRPTDGVDRFLTGVGAFIALYQLLMLSIAAPNNCSIGYMLAALFYLTLIPVAPVIIGAIALAFAFGLPRSTAVWWIGAALLLAAIITYGFLPHVPDSWSGPCAMPSL